MSKVLAILGAVALCGVGCGDNGTNKSDAGMDMAVVKPGPDMAGAGAIGSPCKATTDCHDGTAPVCWTKTLFNTSGYLGVRNGYCSSTCTTDTDCGSMGTCTDFGTQGKFCLANCTAATDCRTGYACFNGNPSNTCFPSGNLTCDPTMNGASCALGGGKEGGCVRAAVGTGNTGFCYDTCLIGKDTCAPNTDGSLRHCIVDDETKDAMGTATGDLWKGPICFDVVTNPGPIADGLECLYQAAGQSSAMQFIDVCIDGDQCDVMNASTMPTGDNLCHQLCYLPGGMSGNDAGVDNTDGGMPAMACATGTCTDVYMLGSDPAPWKRIGLCK